MIPAGARGVDYSFARPPIVRLLEANVRVVCRYISSSRSNAKNVTAGEIERLHAAGIAVLLNWEDSTGDALGGAPAGDTAARKAVAYARDLGYPTGLPIVFSCDTAPQQRPVLMDYYRAAGRACAGAGFTAEAYGGIDLFGWLDAEGLATRLRWQATAWSTAVRRTPALALAAAESIWPGCQAYLLNENYTNPTAVAVHASTHLLQHYGRVEIPTNVVPDSIDENKVYRAFPAWGSADPKDDDMFIAKAPDHPEVYVFDGALAKRHIDGNQLNAAEAAGHRLVSIDWATLQACPDQTDGVGGVDLGPVLDAVNRPRTLS